MCIEPAVFDLSFVGSILCYSATMLLIYELLSACCRLAIYTMHNAMFLCLILIVSLMTFVVIGRL